MSLSQASIASAVRAVNATGRVLERSGIDTPKLESETLRHHARRRAALEDFGDWPIEEPLERLLRAYRDEARLTLIGRITVRELLVSLLENLLRLEAERRSAPEIEAERVASPVFITGLPRTGTTLLHALLAEDPASRAPATWEVMYPAGRHNDRATTERVRRRAQTRLDWANRFAPEFKRIHPIGESLPQECIAITAQVFMSIQFHTTHRVPSYQDWLEQHPQDLGYAFHHRFLQHLQARGGSARWVLKAPGHLFDLAALLRRYPDARIVQTHRDPLSVIASMASLATVLRRAFSDRADPLEIGADWTERWANALERFLSVREHCVAAQFLDVRYEEIEAAPLEVVERVYAFLGWTLTAEARAAMQSFLDANPKGKHGPHRYSLAEYGLDRGAERRRFRRYCERFDIAMSEDG